MLKSSTDNGLTKKNAALLNWIICESGIHNHIFNPKECSSLYNIYQDVVKEDKKEKEKEKE